MTPGSLKYTYVFDHNFASSRRPTRSHPSSTRRKKKVIDMCALSGRQRWYLATMVLGHDCMHFSRVSLNLRGCAFASSFIVEQPLNCTTPPAKKKADCYTTFQGPRIFRHIPLPPLGLHEWTQCTRGIASTRHTRGLLTVFSDCQITKRGRSADFSGAPPPPLVCGPPLREWKLVYVLLPLVSSRRRDLGGHDVLARGTKNTEAVPALSADCSVVDDEDSGLIGHGWNRVCVNSAAAVYLPLCNGRNRHILSADYPRIFQVPGT